MEGGMAQVTREIHRRNLHARGGSFSINLPAGWIRRNGIQNEVEIVETSDGLLIRKVTEVVPTIEDEPEFARFLAFLTQDAMTHPENLVAPDALLDGIAELIEGVEPL
jgi:hypothetical protein